MGRLSRGCFKCRQRRVRCDQGRPSCQHCIKRDEVCEGYRDEATLIFRYETEKVLQHARVAAAGNYSATPASIGSCRRSRSADGRSRPVSSEGSPDSSSLTPVEATSLLNLPSPYPWLKQIPRNAQVRKEDRAVEQFMDKYVLYPCNETSSPGFLEHLPSLFKEVNIEGRYALRWAVRAAAYAEVARDSEGSHVAQKALHCYGEALSALGESLAEPGKTPDDYDLMTIVVLDLFEALFLPDISQVGAHTQGMAQILRLRGSDQFYNPRGWSLFRLAHHRIQKHQLAFNQPALSESTIWLDQLNDRVPFVRMEKDAHEIKQTCERARSLLENAIEDGSVHSVESLQELYELDQTASSWRQGPQWQFKSVSASELSSGLPFPPLTRIVELHGDVWKAYELNYHRTARILFHQQLLKVIEAVLAKPDLPELVVLSLHEMMDRSTTAVCALVESILATVPQSLGDVDHLGHVAEAPSAAPKLLFLNLDTYLTSGTTYTSVMLAISQLLVAVLAVMPALALPTASPNGVSLPERPSRSTLLSGPHAVPMATAPVVRVSAEEVATASLGPPELDTATEVTHSPLRLLFAHGMTIYFEAAEASLISSLLSNKKE
ncbi:hypothetical protein PG997_008232 [Apiospora hydei]|uniref:Zn(2)-C6 fungal-type domain-containing protein n=1 Tax=Apiospora hydei TaxID=1337664 RepID=A0ABR1WA81_9PEZI